MELRDEEVPVTTRDHDAWRADNRRVGATGPDGARMGERDREHGEEDHVESLIGGGGQPAPSLLVGIAIDALE